MRRGRTSGPRPGGRGLTLVEMLITTALFSVAAASVYLLYESMLNTYSKGELRAEVQQSARIALAQITQDLRGAGYDPSGALATVSPGPPTALRAAMPACLSFISYKAPGGTPESVQITYDLSGGILRRRSDPWNPGTPGTSNSFGGGSWADLAQSIASVQFTYYDAGGLVLAPGTEPAAGRCPPSSSGPPPPTSQLSIEQLRRVSRIEVVLRAEAAASRVSSESFVLGNDVHLRNR